MVLKKDMKCVYQPQNGPTDAAIRVYRQAVRRTRGHVLSQAEARTKKIFFLGLGKISWVVHPTMLA